MDVVKACGDSITCPVGMSIPESTARNALFIMNTSQYGYTLGLGGLLDRHSRHGLSDPLPSIPRALFLPVCISGLVVGYRSDCNVIDESERTVESAPGG